MTDGYLDREIDQATIDAATSDIETRYPDIVDAYYKQKLIDLRVYLLICLANQTAADDLYTAKYKLYSKEFDATLKAAQSSIAKVNNNALFSIHIERG